MPRLLILCEYPTLLGGERSMLSTLPAVQAAGFDVHVAAPPTGPLADALRERSVSLAEWPTRYELAELFHRLRPDVVHANSLSTARIAGPVVAAAGVPSIGHLRDIVRLSRQAVADLNCQRRLIAVSEAARAFHVGQGVDAGRCVAIHNGVDLGLFRPRPATGYLHRELRLPPDARLVATIGQIGMRKGTDVALAAAKVVAAELPIMHWLIIGERTSDKVEAMEFEQRLHAVAAEPPLAGRVHFLGCREDVCDILPECTLLVHAARQEPLGRILLEAAACGLAVVATDVGGTREIFPNESDSAALVRADDCAALAGATLELLTDEPRRVSLGHAGRLRAEAAFDVKVAAARLIDQYQAVM
jgi:glycosyltransferase involved in cell wall biosynthesis